MPLCHEFEAGRARDRLVMASRWLEHQLAVLAGVQPLVGQLSDPDVVAARPRGAQGERASGASEEGGGQQRGEAAPVAGVDGPVTGRSSNVDGLRAKGEAATCLRHEDHVVVPA